MTMNPDLPCGDPATQWQWHEAHRDLAKNMYRTSYADASHGREVHVRSEYPSGYGGHVPSLRHDVLHRNSAFDRTYHLRRTDPARDAHPTFKDQIDGIPTVCKFPRGARKNPSHKTVPGDGTTNMAKPPWAISLPVREPPCHRNRPATMSRALSSPALQGGGAAALGGSLRRGNMHAQFAGDDGYDHDAGPGRRNFDKTPHPRGSPLASPAGSRAGSSPAGSRHGGSEDDRMRRGVTIANEEPQWQRMPHESEVLREQLGADWEGDSPYGRQ